VVETSAFTCGLHSELSGNLLDKGSIKRGGVEENEIYRVSLRLVRIDPRM
jgi:hypothetical protein